jgi:AAA family ATP:ADP antiporter
MPGTSEERTTLDRWLSAFAVVRAGEGRTAVLLAANVFTILMAYYVLKPVREALILGEGSAELKSYLSATQRCSFLRAPTSCGSNRRDSPW